MPHPDDFALRHTRVASYKRDSLCTKCHKINEFCVKCHEAKDFQK